MSNWKEARKCGARMIGTGGAAFATLLASADNIEKYLPWTAAVWFTLGPLVAGLWAYEVLCVTDKDDDDAT